MPLVKFYASLRRMTGCKETHVPGETLRQVLDTLRQEYPALGEYLGAEPGKRLIITLNGHPLDPAAGWDVPLSETDQIALFPPIAGG